MHPPHRPKRNQSGEKSVSILVKTFFFFGDHLNLGEKNVWISDFGRKISLNFGEDLFFLFLETTWIWAKKTFEFPISAEKSVSILVKTSEFLRFCASNPPPTKIFWIRHCLTCQLITELQSLLNSTTTSNCQHFVQTHMTYKRKRCITGCGFEIRLFFHSSGH